jgi:hypothetical protein
MKIEMKGAVTCEWAAGAVNLLLRGRGIEILFGGAETVTLPPILHEVRITQLADSADTGRRFRIETSEVQTELRARSVQIHRDAAAAMFAAIPPRPVPLRLRAGWSVLLSVLGIARVGRLILRRRGAS